MADISHSNVSSTNSFSTNSYSASTVTISLSQLDQALQETPGNPDKISSQVFNTIAEQLRESGLILSNGDFIYQDSVENLRVDGGCNTTDIRRMNTEIRLFSDSSLAFQIDSLFEAIDLRLVLKGELTASGVVRQIYAVDIGGCQEVAQDTSSFNAAGLLDITLGLQLSLNPVWQTARTLRLSPTVRVINQSSNVAIEVDVNDTLLAGVIEKVMQDRIEDEVGPGSLNLRLLQIEQALQETLYQQWPEGYVDIVLPENTDAQVNALYQLLSAQARFPLLLDYVEAHSAELMGALLLGDSSALEALASNAALCQASSVAAIKTPRKPLFQINDGQCTSRIPSPTSELTSAITDSSTDNSKGNRQQWFSDPDCEYAIAFAEQDMATWCESTLNPERLGNADVLGELQERWSLSPATRFDIGALSLEGTHQPYVYRTEYKRVSTTGGECSLEMRVYRQSPIDELEAVLREPAVSAKPILALHGGSWQYRGNGMLGIEATVAHFTEQAHVVFAPFYRLLGDKDGNSACNNASFDQILQDVEHAFTWVEENSHRFGVTGKPVVFGQSAGGHLAARLALDHAERVDSALVYYAPVDFAHLLKDINAGVLTDSRLLAILEVVSGFDSSQLQLDDPIVANNSLPARIATAPAPPFFILHGVSDSLVPFSQASRLCNALAGDIEGGPAPLVGLDNVASENGSLSLAQRYDCGPERGQVFAPESGLGIGSASMPVGSRLRLFTEAEHALDICLWEGLCPAGTAQSAEQVAIALREAIDWAGADWSPVDQASLAQPNSSGLVRSGGGTVSFLILALMLWMPLRRVMIGLQP